MPVNSEEGSVSFTGSVAAQMPSASRQPDLLAYAPVRQRPCFVRVLEIGSLWLRVDHPVVRAVRSPQVDGPMHKPFKVRLVFQEA